jgi:hypothetical protein
VVPKLISIISILIAATAGCQKVDNRFYIEDADRSVSSAEVHLCGRQLKLFKVDSHLHGSLASKCEGEGNISVKLSNGDNASCHIGYVTPGAEQVFKFSIERGKCRTLPN